MKYPYIFLLLYISLNVSTLRAQKEMKKYVLENVSKINSVNMEDTAYSDLDILKNSIGERKIVMLGELYHGDGTTFKAKSRIIKFLHEKMGFNVLIFESDFFALNQGWNDFTNGVIPIDSLIVNSVYDIWTYCQQAHDVFNYIKNQSLGYNKLKISGVDNQLLSPYTKNTLRKTIDSYLQTSNIPFVKTSQYINYLNLLEKKLLWYAIDKTVLDTIIANSEEIVSELAQKGLEREFSTMAIHNIIAYSKQLNGLSENRMIQIYPGLRDSQMSMNLEWVANVKYPKEKIIIWAHNRHIFKNTDDSYNKEDKAPPSMGNLFTRDSINRRNTYIIGFTEYKGQGEMLLQKSEKINVSRSRKNSLESWIHEKEFPFAFIDFTKFKSTSNFFMKTYIGSEHKSNWNEQFDGILYIEKMESCIEKKPFLDN